MRQKLLRIRFYFMKPVTGVKFIFAILICQAAGLLGTIFTVPAIPTWYAALQKPAFALPNWLFAPAWFILYTLMGITLYRLWIIKGNDPRVKHALKLFFIQFMLNSLWSFLFFGLRNPLAGFAGILVLESAIVLTFVFSWKVDRVAALLLVPYILWVAFASALNFSILILN